MRKILLVLFLILPTLLFGQAILRNKVTTNAITGTFTQGEVMSWDAVNGRWVDTAIATNDSSQSPGYVRTIATLSPTYSANRLTAQEWLDPSGFRYVSIGGDTNLGFGKAAEIEFFGFTTNAYDNIFGMGIVKTNLGGGGDLRAFYWRIKDPFGGPGDLGAYGVMGIRYDSATPAADVFDEFEVYGHFLCFDQEGNVGLGHLRAISDANPGVHPWAKVVAYGSPVNSFPTFGITNQGGTRNALEYRGPTNTTVIDYAGNIGIGTNAPVAALHVSGNQIVTSITNLGAYRGTGNFTNIGTINGLIHNSTANALTIGNHDEIKANSTFFSPYAGYQSPNATASVFLGYKAGMQFTNGLDSVAAGFEAGNLASYSDQSVFIGRASGQLNTNSQQFTAVGYHAGTGGSASSGGTRVGSTAGESATNSPYSAWVGYASGARAHSSSHTAFTGYRSGTDASNSYRSTFYGSYSGYQATNSEYATGVGTSAGDSACDADYSFFGGFRAGNYASGSSNAIFVGPDAGYAATNSPWSVFIGPSVGMTAAATNSLGMGRGALAGFKGKDRLEIAYTNLNATPLIRGDFTTGDLTVAATTNITLATLTVRVGSVSPESAVTAPVGSIYLRTGGGAGTTFYVKESGSGNTGWVGK